MCAPDCIGISMNEEDHEVEELRVLINFQLTSNATFVVAKKKRR